MRVPKVKPQTAAQLTIVEMTDVKLQWTSHGTRRDGLPEDHPTTMFGIWQDRRLLMLFASHDDATLFAELEADRLNVPVVDLAANLIRMTPDDDWIELPPS